MPAFGPCRRACGCAGLFFLPPDSAVLSVFAASLFAPSFFPSSVFLLPARISHCPCFSLPVSPSVRVSLSPQLPSFVGSSSVVCIPSGFSSVISCFSVHRPSLAACCPSPVAPSIVQRLPLVVHRSLRRPSSIARRLLSVAHCLSLAAHCLSLAAHCLSLAARCPSLAACCPSLVAPFIVHRPSFVVRRPLSIPCRPLPVTCRPLFIARCVARTPSPCRASFRCPSVRITAFVSAESRPACLRELLAVSFRSGFRRSVFPQKCVRPPYLGRRAVSDKITPCILLSGAIFPARPAILLTIWQRLPFGTTFVQIQGVTGAPDPQGGRIPAARKENGKNINN